jgi:hypothetical protein
LTSKPTIPTLVSQLANDSGFLTSVGNISNIRSEGNINIDINLSDSTLRRWQFGEDGDTVFPVGISIKSNGGLYRSIVADPGLSFGLVSVGEGNASTGWNDSLTSPTQQANIQFNNYGIGRKPNATILVGGAGGNKTWKFDVDGILTLPSTGKISNSGYDWTFGTDGALTLPNGAVIKDTAGNSVVFGEDAGTTSQGANAVAIGAQAGNSDQGTETVAIGAVAGISVQGQGAVAVGFGAGYNLQGVNSVAIGKQAGLGSQGANAIAIGYRAGDNNQAANTIILNASGAIFNGVAEQTNSFYVAPIRSATATANVVYYNTTAKEVTYGAAGSVAAGTLTGTALASGVVSSSLTSVGTLGTLRVTGDATAETFNTDQITVVGNRIATTVTNANLEIECNGTGALTISGSIIGTATQNVFNTISTTVNAFGAATTLNIGASGAPITGFAATATTSSTASSLGYLGLPQSATATTATLAIGDAGKHIYVTTASQTITIPANASVAYPIGTTITFIAGPSATTVSIAIATDTMYLGGTGTTGTRTLAAYGMATAVKVAATTWYINGSGLT